MGAVSNHGHAGCELLFSHTDGYADLYTPFSFEPNDTGGYRLTLAVGDFETRDVSVVTHGRSLIVCGRRQWNLVGQIAGILPSGFHWQSGLPGRLRVLRTGLSSGLLTVNLGRRPITAPVAPTVLPRTALARRMPLPHTTAQSLLLLDRLFLPTRFLTPNSAGHRQHGERAMFLRCIHSLGIIVATWIAAGPLSLAACNNGAPSTPASRYVLNGGEATDSETGLTWQRCSVGQTWKEDSGGTGTVQTFGKTHKTRPVADGACRRRRSSQPLSTKSAHIDKKCTPPVNPDVFPTMDPVDLAYWTSARTGSQLAWIIGFQGGSDFDALPEARNPVRLVKGRNKK